MESCEIGPTTGRQRRQDAFQVRLDAAIFQRDLPLPGHPCNGDEDLYPNKIGNFSKALPHNQLGEVDLSAYKAYLRALSTGNPDDFEMIPLRGGAKLANPQSAYAYELAGPDSHHLSIPPAPAFSSAWNASEMAELYWLALTRDVPFAEYDTNPLTLAAAYDLSKFSDFRGPKVNGEVTTGTLFRGSTPGDLVGPYISQFLWKNIPFGASTIVQRNRTTVAGDDYLTSYQDWLNIQNGFSPSTSNQFDPTPRYIRNNRDLGEWNQRDFSYQGCLGACLILLSYGPAALSQTNPYLRSLTQTGFATFAAQHILDFVARAARAANLAGWFQKFLVHRRLRPEAFGGRVHNLLMGAADYPVNENCSTPRLLAKSSINTAHTCCLWPIPKAHLTIRLTRRPRLRRRGMRHHAESFLQGMVYNSRSGGGKRRRTTLLPYTGEPLTVGGEINKLATNVGYGRNAAGVHWRTDGSEGLKLGEAVAIGILQDYKELTTKTSRASPSPSSTAPP